MHFSQSILRYGAKCHDYQPHGSMCLTHGAWCIVILLAQTHDICCVPGMFMQMVRMSSNRFPALNVCGGCLIAGCLGSVTKLEGAHRSVTAIESVNSLDLERQLKYIAADKLPMLASRAQKKGGASHLASWSSNCSSCFQTIKWSIVVEQYAAKFGHTGTYKSNWTPSLAGFTQH
jgi:hypothetical protein